MLYLCNTFIIKCTLTVSTLPIGDFGNLGWRTPQAQQPADCERQAGTGRGAELGRPRLADAGNDEDCSSNTVKRLGACQNNPRGGDAAQGAYEQTTAGAAADGWNQRLALAGLWRNPSQPGEQCSMCCEVDGAMLDGSRCWIRAKVVVAVPVLGRPYRTRREAATTVGADVLQNRVRAANTERAFVAADSSLD